jgi:hypothetical protein
VYLQILPGRSLPMWMPEPQSGAREDRLRMRGRLQVRSYLRLQALVRNAIVPRIAPLGLVQSPDWGRYAASSS